MADCPARPPGQPHDRHLSSECGMGYPFGLNHKDEQCCWCGTRFCTKDGVLMETTSVHGPYWGSRTMTTPPAP